MISSFPDVRTLNFCIGTSFSKENKGTDPVNVIQFDTLLPSKWSLKKHANGHTKKLFSIVLFLSFSLQFP